VNLNGAGTQQACLDRFKEVLETVINHHDPLPVIVRVSFIGDTEAHTQMVGDLEYWKEAVRSTAVANFGERTWIEKVNVHTRPKDSGRHKGIDPGPLLELETLVSDIKADQDSLLALGSELSNLFRKLPAEYRQGDGAFNLDDPRRLSQIVDQAHALLAQGLKKEAPDA
jgi:hypothetical protein